MLSGANEAIRLTNNEAERLLQSFVLWRKGRYGAWSHRGEQFRRRILTIVESCRKIGANPLQWLRAIVRRVIEKTECPSLPELDALSQWPTEYCYALLMVIYYLKGNFSNQLSWPVKVIIQ